MREYYADVTLSNEIEEWLLLQEATVVPTGYNIVNVKQKPIQTYEVYFGHRKIHFYSGSNQIRIFFNENTVGSALVLLMKWPEAVFKHNLPKNL